MRADEPGSVWLADLSWPDVGKWAQAGAVLAVPLGSTEEHGPHLPLSTDTDIAVVLCERLAAVREDVLIAPALDYGSSGEHSAYPGTLSIGQAALEMLVVELGRSATETFEHLVGADNPIGPVQATSRYSWMSPPRTLVGRMQAGLESTVTPP